MTRRTGHTEVRTSGASGCSWLTEECRTSRPPVSLVESPSAPAKEGVAEDIEEAVRCARSDEEARLIFLRLQMDRA
eukprot:5944371-Lingulodinium_polyedra.AAC.1